MKRVSELQARIPRPALADKLISSVCCLIKGICFEHREVKVDDLKTALYAIDPTIDDLTMDNYIYLAYQVPKEELEQAVPLPLETIIEKLLAGDIRRAGPLPEEASRPAPEEGEPRDYDYY